MKKKCVPPGSVDQRSKPGATAIWAQVVVGARVATPGLQTSALAGVAAARRYVPTPGFGLFSGGVVSNTFKNMVTPPLAAATVDREQPAEGAGSEKGKPAPSAGKGEPAKGKKPVEESADRPKHGHGAGRGRGVTKEQRERFEKMSPEEREKMRQQWMKRRKQSGAGEGRRQQ